MWLLCVGVVDGISISIGVLGVGDGFTYLPCYNTSISQRSYCSRFTYSNPKSMVLVLSPLVSVSVLLVFLMVWGTTTIGTAAATTTTKNTILVLSRSRSRSVSFGVGDTRHNRCSSRRLHSSRRPEQQQQRQQLRSPSLSSSVAFVVPNHSRAVGGHRRRGEQRQELRRLQFSTLPLPTTTQQASLVFCASSINNINNDRYSHHHRNILSISRIMSSSSSSAALGATGGSGGIGDATGNGFLGFLANSKSTLLQSMINKGEERPPTSSVLHVSLGNPAGDCDSIVSAITLAFIDSMLPPEGGDSGTGTRSEIVPIVSIPKRALRTQRPETSLLLKWATVAATSSNNDGGMNAVYDNLICIDEFAELLTKSNSNNLPQLHMTLVDHNKLAWSIDTNNLNVKVVEILDHHIDEGMHVETCQSGSSQRKIAFDPTTQKALVASTCTLLVERLLSKLGIEASSPASSAVPKIPTDVAVLLLGTILLDSVNLLPSAKKVTQRDIDAVDALLKYTNWSSLASPGMLSKGLLVEDTSGTSSKPTALIRPNCTKWFETLQEEKFSPEFWNQLTAYDCLALDYKSFTTTASSSTTSYSDISFGMASILTPLSNFFTKSNMEDDILQFFNDQNDNIKVLVIMSCTSDTNSGKLQRELAVVTTKENTSIFDSVLDYLQSSDSGKSLQLEPLDLVQGADVDESCAASTMITKNGLKVISMKQLNIGMSRKQVAPILLDFFGNEKMDSSKNL